MEQKVCILLCTFNGDRFLKKQINSIIKQTHKNWSVVISDDGSTDQTKQLIMDFQTLIGAKRIKLIDGPENGFAENFLHGLRNSKDEFDYYAFCDHDDVWETTKLERAINAMRKETSKNKPTFFCSTTNLIDENDKFITKSPIRRTPNFCHSLVENIAGGNTMVFNLLSKQLILSIPSNMKIVSHDWTLYQLVTGVGGIIKYELTPTVFYRQHSKNAVGTKLSFIGKYERLMKFFNGDFKVGINNNLEVLNFIKSQLTVENKIKLELFQKKRSDHFRSRLSFIFDKNFVRSSFLENVILKLGNIFKRV